jgi:hypothetical protein
MGIYVYISGVKWLFKNTQVLKEHLECPGMMNTHYKVSDNAGSQEVCRLVVWGGIKDRRFMNSLKESEIGNYVDQFVVQQCSSQSTLCILKYVQRSEMNNKTE